MRLFAFVPKGKERRSVIMNLNFETYFSFIFELKWRLMKEFFLNSDEQPIGFVTGMHVACAMCPNCVKLEKWPYTRRKNFMIFQRETKRPFLLNLPSHIVSSLTIFMRNLNAHF